jgi:hypothetical protein
MIVPVSKKSMDSLREQLGNTVLYKGKYLDTGFKYVCTFVPVGEMYGMTKSEGLGYNNLFL